MKECLVPFYLEGRGIERINRLRDGIDFDDVIEKILEGALLPREALQSAAVSAVMPLSSDNRKRLAWVAEHKEEIGHLISELGGSITPQLAAAEAWQAYIAGVTDELAFVSEPDLLDDLEGDDDDGDVDDEEDDEAGGES